MRLIFLVFASITTLAGTLPRPAFASDSATASVVVSARFSSRTSLTVSTELLRFDVARPSEPATAAVEFAAGVRTREGGEVVLSVEPLRGVEGPGGAADVESAVTFEGQGSGTVGGTLAGMQTVAGRWTGSGLRAGRVVFSLRAAAAGQYQLPVRFVLTAP